jgi:hypothetical protein
MGCLKLGVHQQVELADVLLKFGDWKTYSQQENKVINRIINCRTLALGGHKQKCDHCNAEHILYNSCCDRHCPKCQYLERQKWVEARINDLLPVQYFHLVFTMSSHLYKIFLKNKKICYNLFFKASSDTIKEVVASKLKAEAGFYGVHHSWNQQQGYHPHAHYVVAGGGLNEDQWISSKQNYFLPIRILSKVFRGKLLSLLEANFNNFKDMGSLEKFKIQLKKAAQKKWVVYCKKPFAGPKQVIEYLGNYTHRIALSNSRIISIKGDEVSFTYRDRKDNNKTKVLTLKGSEFIKRFLNHIVPKKFNRIRYYGFLGRRGKKKKLEKIRTFLNIKKVEEQSFEKDWKELLKEKLGLDPTLCKVCEIGHMIKIGRVGSTLLQKSKNTS